MGLRRRLRGGAEVSWGAANGGKEGGPRVLLRDLGEGAGARAFRVGSGLEGALCAGVVGLGRDYMHGKTCSVDLDARGAQRLDVIAEEAMEDCSA